MGRRRWQAPARQARWRPPLGVRHVAHKLLSLASLIPSHSAYSLFLKTTIVHGMQGPVRQTTAIDYGREGGADMWAVVGRKPANAVAPNRLNAHHNHQAQVEQAVVVVT